MRLEEEVEFGPYNKPNTCNCTTACQTVIYKRLMKYVQCLNLMILRCIISLFYL